MPEAAATLMFTCRDVVMAASEAVQNEVEEQFLGCVDPSESRLETQLLKKAHIIKTNRSMQISMASLRCEEHAIDCRIISFVITLHCPHMRSVTFSMSFSRLSTRPSSVLPCSSAAQSRFLLEMSGEHWYPFARPGLGNP